MEQILLTMCVHLRKGRTAGRSGNNPCDGETRGNISPSEGLLGGRREAAKEGKIPKKPNSVYFLSEILVNQHFQASDAKILANAVINAGHALDLLPVTANKFQENEFL